MVLVVVEGLQSDKDALGNSHCAAAGWPDPVQTIFRLVMMEELMFPTTVQRRMRTMIRNLDLAAFHCSDSGSQASGPRQSCDGPGLHHWSDGSSQPVCGHCRQCECDFSESSDARSAAC